MGTLAFASRQPVRDWRSTNEARKQYLGQIVKAFGKIGIVTKVCAHNHGPICLVKMDNGQTMVPFADEIEGIVIGYAISLEELLAHAQK